MLEGFVRAKVASKAEWILCTEALQVRLMELKSTATVKEVHM